MNTRGVNALAGVIGAAMQTRQTAAGIAMAVEAAGMLQSPETASAHAAEIERLTRVAEREHKAFIDTHGALNVLREDATRVMAENGVQAQQAELERVREQAAKYKEDRRVWSAKYRETTAERDRLQAERAELNEMVRSSNAKAAEALARTAELERQVRALRQAQSERHDDLAGALGYPHEDWADLISIAAANTAALARSGGDR